ncbi:MAG: tryptophan--tRNA ligase [Clostridia bacterium]|nr:tryptophan--tRNA ligase [Clostridia bacterium]
MPEENVRKKVVLSGIQPSGIPHLGNYIGAIRNWKRMEDEFDCLYMIANMHSITVRQDPAKLRRQTYEGFATLLAAGLDPEKSILFVQNQVPAHAELAWILNCYTMFGEMSRMTQFKDKSAKNAENINVGLFTYPVLMAADILLYQADAVPVGADQKQHVEIARDIAQRFNSIYGDTFTLPEPYIPEAGARIMSLADPDKKMSKSDDNPNACVLVSDSKDDIIRKFRRAVTDSGSEVRRGEGKSGINNLITIYSVASGKSAEEVEREFEGKGYGDFKLACGEAVADFLRPFRENIDRYMADKAHLDALFKLGAERAARIARRTVEKAEKRVGFIKKP